MSGRHKSLRAMAGAMALKPDDTLYYKLAVVALVMVGFAALYLVVDMLFF